MKSQRYYSVGLAVLCSLIVLLSGNVSAQSSSSAPSDTCTDDFMADGDCDLNNNTEDCGYDGGDCCECTCVSTDLYECGVRTGFSCADPSASCYVAADDDTEETSAPTIASPSTPAPVTPTTRSPATAPTSPPVASPTPAPSTAATPPTTSPTSPPVSSATRAPLTATPSSTTSSSSTTPTSTSTTPCDADSLSDGNCDLENNSVNCGYDGGDCCECTCISTDFTCGDNGYDCVDPDSSCEVGYVEAATKTTVSASANAYDERPGADSDSNGCFIDGCDAELTRDGITADTESRWSCAAKLVPGGLACAIDFVFDDVQDIKDVEVAFYKGEERSRTVQASIDGVVVGEYDSYTGSTFNSLGIQGDGVETLTLTAVGLTEFEWISFLEVRIMVEA